MSQFGINNVRGGSFCEIKLNDDQIGIINKMITGSTNKCYICGENGHFANNCDKNDYEITKQLEKLKQLCIDNDLCFRCYRKGHYEADCYAKKTIAGNEISDSDEETDVYSCKYCNKNFETIKSMKCHENKYCKYKKVCYRCKRKGHNLLNCSTKKMKSNDEDDEIEVYCCEYCDKEFTTAKGAQCHENLYCKYKN